MLSSKAGLMNETQHFQMIAGFINPAYGLFSINCWASLRQRQPTKYLTYGMIRLGRKQISPMDITFEFTGLRGFSRRSGGMRG